MSRPETRVALITGGASGIGKAMALSLVSQGWRVAVLDIDADALRTLADSDTGIVPYPCDVTDGEQVRQVIAEVASTLGPVDRFMHCAAIMPGGLLHETPADEINRVMHINYTGLVNAAQAMLPAMRARQRGEFIVMGSVAGFVHQVKFGAYGATKAATNFYMQVLMQENAHSGISFLLVCPSTVDTPLVKMAAEDGPRFLRGSKWFGTQVITPEFVVASIERGLKHHKRIIYPGIAGLMAFLYTFFPRLIRTYGEFLS